MQKTAPPPPAHGAAPSGKFPAAERAGRLSAPRRGFSCQRACAARRDTPPPVSPGDFPLDSRSMWLGNAMEYKVGFERRQVGCSVFSRRSSLKTFCLHQKVFCGAEKSVASTKRLFARVKSLLRQVSDFLGREQACHREEKVFILAQEARWTEQKPKTSCKKSFAPTKRLFRGTKRSFGVRRRVFRRSSAFRSGPKGFGSRVLFDN